MLMLNIGELVHTAADVATIVSGFYTLAHELVRHEKANSVVLKNDQAGHRGNAARNTVHNASASRSNGRHPNHFRAAHLLAA